MFLVFLFFNVVFLLDGYRHLFVEPVACHDSYELTRSTFTNLPTWTGIECQLDMPSGNDKSYTRICDAAVIARLWLLKEDWVARARQVVWGRDRSTPVASLTLGRWSSACGANTFSRALCAFCQPQPIRIYWMLRDLWGSSPTLQASLERSTLPG